MNTTSRFAVAGAIFAMTISNTNAEPAGLADFKAIDDKKHEGLEIVA